MWYKEDGAYVWWNIASLLQNYVFLKLKFEFGFSIKSNVESQRVVILKFLCVIKKCVASWNQFDRFVTSFDWKEGIKCIRSMCHILIKTIFIQTQCWMVRKCFQSSVNDFMNGLLLNNKSKSWIENHFSYSVFGHSSFISLSKYRITIELLISQQRR